MPHWPIPKGNRDINLGLDRINLLMDKLGNPHKNLPPIIHVAGTNGKGSTIAFINQLLPICRQCLSLRDTEYISIYHRT